MDKEKKWYETAFEKAQSEPFANIDLMGQEVHFRRCDNGKDVWFCAYVNLENSRFIKDGKIGYPTFRKDDILGVDTMHAFNEKDIEIQKFISAIMQIQHVIEDWKETVKEV